MFNQEAYDAVVDNSGYKKRYIAAQIGLGYDTYLKKSAGKLEWKIPEVMAFCKVLKVDRKTMYSIFFN